MPISDGYVRVECDVCEESLEINLTPLAIIGEYDSRNVLRDAERLSWWIDGDEVLCPSCYDERYPDDGEY